MMTREEARRWAARAWCDEPNASKEMDVQLAESFAHILQTRVEEAVQSQEIITARATMVRAFERDGDFYETYVANVAMLLYDRYGIIDRDARDEAARDILKLVFEG